MEKEKSKSRKLVEKDDLKNRRDRDRSKERKKERDSEKRREKDRRKRRHERVKSSDSEEEDESHREVDEERLSKRKDKYKDRKSSRHREKERGYRREDERDRGKYRIRDREEYKDRERDRREGEKERKRENLREGVKEDSDDHDKLESKRRRKDHEKSVDRSVNGEKKTREEEVEDEQKQLDDEAEKRRRRVQEWQELKRQKEETGIESKDPKESKAWTLDGESDDDEQSPLEEKPETDMDVDGETKTEYGDDAKMVELGNVVEDQEEIDPLDAFMNTMVLPEVEKLSNSVPGPVENYDGIYDSKKNEKESGHQRKKGFNKALGRIIQGEDSDSDFSEPADDDDDRSLDEDDEEFMKRVKKTKVEKLSLVDHSRIEYEPFRKNFYIQVNDISRMTQEEVNDYRKELELKVHGKDVPRPIKSWHQTGLTSRILDTLKKLNYEMPMPIQAQSLPIIMSGRDCIGVAKTGSGKTLGFVLPMLRHIKDQPPVEAGDGPIGLVMAPTRELVQQIHSDIKKFAKVLGIRSVPVYGGSGVAQQISDLKRGTEIVVCTPGRMIDILCTSSGKITNLRRVTFLVMDEADRMFDMGFEPQITRIIQNIRPDHQTVLFSATFPRQVETLARKVLNKPVEIQAGGRSVVNKDIAQLIEIRPESERHSRLLELLGEWYEKGKVLVFVQSQDKCDSLYKDLMNRCYACLSLHGGKDQTDRESAISDFKSNVCNLLIATSVAARGLDVKDLELVVNFDPPNHYEDYVHRVGRTGRAGKKGCAVTFISEDDAKYAPDLVKALELSEQAVPDDLKAIADGFMAKVKQGIEQAHGTGYGGSGFKFNEEEEDVRKAAKKAQAKEYGFEEDKSDSEEENDVVRKTSTDNSQQHQANLAQVAAIAAAARASAPACANQMLPNGVLPVTIPGLASDGTGRVAAMIAAANLEHNLAKIQGDAMPERYEAELIINDFPQNARWKITHKETLGPISDWSGAAITTRGQFYTQGRIPGPGERKLYLFIEGPTEKSVKTAKAELKRVLEDITNHALSLPGGGSQPGKYSVL